MTKTTPASTTVRFRYIDPATDQEYVGEAAISTQHFNEEYEGGETHQDASILNVWHVDDLGNCTRVNRMERWFEIHLEAAAIEQHNYPPAMPVQLPADWDEDGLVIVTKVTAVMNITTKHPLPSCAPGSSEKIQSVTPLHIVGENSYVVSTTCPPSEAIAELRKMAGYLQAQA